MITEIYIEGQKLDLTADLSSLLTFALDDIKNFASRSTAFSKTIVFPGTQVNNGLFGNIFEIGQANAYDSAQSNVRYNFNASKSARVLVFQDNLQTFKGTIRLLEIVQDRGRIEYETALNGELTGLSVALSGGLLEDLDFSEHDHIWNTSNVILSWDNAGGTGYYYPLIDYGTYSTNKHDWEFNTFRPALYVREYIDKMFTAAGYRWQCDLFDTDRFKHLVVPHNRKKILVVSPNSFKVTANSQSYDQGGDTPLSYVPFVNEIQMDGFTANVDHTEFTATENIAGTLTVRLVGDYVKTIGSTLRFYLQKNFVTKATYAFGSGTTTGSYDFTLTMPEAINTGDVITVEFDSPATVTISIGSGYIQVANPTEVELNYGAMLEVNKTIPKNIRQVDFLLSIVQLFNLYIYESQFDEKLILISPFISFYDGSAVDWSMKLNRDQPWRLKPMSELNAKYYQYMYKSDSDYWNELYKKRYNKNYGDQVFDTEFEFANQTNKIELIFAPSPLVGYAGEEKVFPAIYKRTGTDTAPVEENIDSVIRILQTKKITGVASWQMKYNGATVATLTSYGYGGHFDDPDNPDNDLNFGVCEELFFILATGNLLNTQFNVYWSGYMGEITDKDSKLFTGKFYLTPKDIFDLRFSRFVYLDGVLFRLNKITDYNASHPGECTVEMLTVINQNFRFPPGSTVLDDYALLWSDLSSILYDTGQEMKYK